MPPGGTIEVALPIGSLTQVPRGVRVELAHNARTRAHVRAIVERLAGNAAEYFWIPTTIGDGEELALEYALDGAATTAFSDALAAFRAAPAVHLPELVEMARYLEVCVTHLERIEVPAVIGPACLHYAPDRAGPGSSGPWHGNPGLHPPTYLQTRGAWRLVVVPLVDVSLADWARAAPDAWLWTPASVLIGAASSPGAYAIGAALCTALAGDLFPAHLAPGEQLRRALRGWVGDRARLDRAVRDALPASFVDERGRLVDLALALLEPAPPADWRAQLARIAEQLAPYRTAVRWEYEGSVAIARGILERMAASRPPARVPWDVVSRLRGRMDDDAGALDAAIHALDRGEDDAVRELAAVSRRIGNQIGNQTGKAAGAQHGLIARAVAAVDRVGAQLGDAGRLHFAHIEARYLGRFAEAQARLTAPMAAPWDEVLRACLSARFHAERGAWPHVAKLCKQARAATQAMPLGGGELGAYLIAYVEHLDGVAHHGATRQFADAGYLADAFARLVASIDGARKLAEPADELVEASARWLLQVAALAEQMQLVDQLAIRTGIAASLAAYGLRPAETGARTDPAIAWYDAGRLLALSGVS